MKTDFTTMQLKANASGSWMNVLWLKVQDEAAVRAACLALVKAAQGSLKFKLLDAAGGEVAYLGGKGRCEWQESSK